jgi:hypothetical protein
VISQMSSTGIFLLERMSKSMVKEIPECYLCIDSVGMDV